MNPWNATSPQSRLKPTASLKVLHTDPADGWSIAEMTWDGQPGRKALRWDGDLNNPHDRGNPTSHGNGTWFVLPDAVAEVVLRSVTPTPAPKP